MLVEDMATYGKYPVDWAKEATLRAAVPTYDMGMYEQNVLIYRLTSDPSMMQRVRPPALVQTAACAAACGCDVCILAEPCMEAMSRFAVHCNKADGVWQLAVQMYFENAYCINCWYKDLDEPFIEYPPFVIHYAGCQMCTGDLQHSHAHISSVACFNTLLQIH